MLAIINGKIPKDGILKRAPEWYRKYVTELQTISQEVAKKEPHYHETAVKSKVKNHNNLMGTIINYLMSGLENQALICILD